MRAVAVCLVVGVPLAVALRFQADSPVKAVALLFATASVTVLMRILYRRGWLDAPPRVTPAWARAGWDVTTLHRRRGAR